MVTTFEKQKSEEQTPGVAVNIECLDSSASKDQQSMEDSNTNQ